MIIEGLPYIKTKKQKAREDWAKNLEHQIACGDGTGGTITSHSHNCPEGLYFEDKERG